MKKLLLKIVLGLVTVYAVVGFFVLPGVVKTQIQENASTVLKRKVSVDDVYINPFSFRVEIEKFRIAGLNGEDALVAIRKIFLDLDPIYLLKGEINVALIQINSPFINVHKKADGSFNFSDLLVQEHSDTTKTEEAAATAIPNILVGKFAIKRGKVHFSDDNKADTFVVDLRPINFTVHDFSTQQNHNNALSLHIEVDDGAFIEYKGKVNSLEPLKLEGEFTLHSGRLYTQWKYFEDILGFVVADGTLDASLSYKANLSASPMQVYINQYKLDINNLRLQDKQSKEDMLKLPRLSLNGDVDVGAQQVNVDAFDIKGLQVKAIQNGEGQINWLSYLPESNASETAQERNSTTTNNPWKIDIKHVGINTQMLSFEEQYAPEPYKAGIKGLDLNLNDIHIDDKVLDINSYELHLADTFLKETQGKEVFLMPHFMLAGSAKVKQQAVQIDKLFLEEISLSALKESNGKLNFEKYAPYAQTQEKVAVKEEKASAPWKLDLEQMRVTTQKVNFQDLSAKEPFRVDIKDINLSLGGFSLDANSTYLEHFTTQVRGVKLRPLQAKKSWTGFSSLEVNGALNRGEEIDLVINDVLLKGLYSYVDMDKKGEINFTRLASKLQSKVKKESKKNKQENRAKWEVKNVDIKNAKVFYKDNFNAKGALVKVDKINLNLKDIHSDGKTWLKSKLSLRINESGKLSVQSRVRQTPLKVHANVKMKTLDLTSFQAFIDKKANVDLQSGRLNFDFKADYTKKKTVVIANTQINDLNLSERQEGKSFFRFSKLVVKNINLNLNPDQMKIDKIDIYQPYARMKVAKDKSTNLDNLMVSEANSTQESNATVVAQDKKKPFSVFIGKVNFKDGTGSFADLSLPLPFNTDIHALNGQMIGLGTLEDIKTITDINGQVDEYGLMRINGSLLSANPKKFTDMSVKFQNIDMTNLSPYTGKFIGYELKEGKMNVELEYKIKDSDMQGGNRIVLKKLTLGDEIESEDAISAPVGLAIALLKDSDGVIDLDIPVKGNVDAPEFEIGHVVWTAFKNMIVGVATAPFRFLGNALGMSEDELDNVTFEEGKYLLLPPEKEKLDKLATALTQKQMLTLQVAGSYDKKRDLLALKTASVYKEALSKIDDNTTDISKMDRDDLDDLLKEMYIAHFKEEQLDKLEAEIDKLEIPSDTKKLALREEMKVDLINDQKVGEKELLALADKRAKVIIKYLVSKTIAPERLSQLESFDIEIAKEDNEYIPSQLKLGAK